MFDIKFDVSNLIGIICLGMPILLALIFVIAATFSSGKSDYCYIDAKHTNIHLYQHVPWQPDRYVGMYRSIADANKDAVILKCEIK